MFENLTFKDFVIAPATPVLKFKKLHPDAKPPQKDRKTDFGYDLFALEDTLIEPGAVTKVRTGLAFGFPVGFGGILKDRSGVATKLEIQTVAGVIDNEYTGEVMVPFFSAGKVTLWVDPSDEKPILLNESVVYIRKGDKIAQMVLLPVYHFDTVEVEELSDTSRGDKGFGSSGM